MNPVVLYNIPFEIDTSILIEKLHIDPESEDAEKIKCFAKEASKIGKPKALYFPAYVESRSDNFVIINGIKFTSKVLSINLQDIYRVFPYVVTCGRELYDWSQSIEDMVERYWAQTICEMALDSGRKAFYDDIKKRFEINHFSRMSPGSLKDWPISEQKKLFELLGDTRESIGVTLTGNFLMLPIKSVSGILFPTEVSFESCQLCPKEGCPNRRAPYDSALLNNKYKL